MAQERRQWGELPLGPESMGLGHYTQSAELPLPELYNLDRQKFFEAAADARERAMNEARSGLAAAAASDKDFTFGAVIKPKPDPVTGKTNLSRWKMVLREADGANNLEFSPYDYTIFDARIMQKCGADKASGEAQSAIFNENHPDYENYSTLRRNLALLRNYLLVTMPPTGKNGHANLAKIGQMADKIGEALTVGTKQNIFQRFLRSLKNLFTGKNISEQAVGAFLATAAVPDKGIAVMYDHLFALQNGSPSLFEFVPAVKANSPRAWNLSPREQTPFSNEDMGLYSRSTAMTGISNAFDGIVADLNSVDTLTRETKKISVDHAEVILRKLRMIIGNPGEEANLSPYTDSRQAEARMMLSVALAYKETMNELLEDNPNLIHKQEFIQAADALGKIAYRIKAETAVMLAEEGEPTAAAAMVERMSATPERYKNTSGATIQELLKTLAVGLHEAGTLEKELRARGIHRAPALHPQAAAIHAIKNSSDMISSGQVDQVSHAGLIDAAQKMNRQAQSPDAPLITPSGKAI